MMPRKNPFRFIVAATVATAIADPIQGTVRAILRDNRAPPQRTSRFVVGISMVQANS
jgi:hypothetical protein